MGLKIDLFISCTLFYLIQNNILNKNMSDILNQQQEMMKRIQEFIEQEKEKLNTIYSECITKMNDCNPNKQVYDDIDELWIKISSPSQPRYFNNISYWYDINKKQFIKPINNYIYHIYKRYNFNIYLENCLFHKESGRNKISIPIKLFNFGQNHKFGKQNYIQINKLEQIVSDGNYYINQHINIQTKQPNIKTEIYLDHNLNIYIPSIQTIIVNNYTKIPKFVLESNIKSDYYKDCNKIDNIILNEHNEEDKKCYDTINNVITHFNNYVTSQDQRNKFNDGKLFQDILDFINYNEMIKDVKQFLDFSSKLRVCGKEDIKVKKELEVKNKIIKDKDKIINDKDKQIKKELEMNKKIITEKDKEIERLKLEMEELKKFYIDS